MKKSGWLEGTAKIWTEDFGESGVITPPPRIKLALILLCTSGSRTGSELASPGLLGSSQARKAATTGKFVTNLEQILKFGWNSDSSGFYEALEPVIEGREKGLKCPSLAVQQLLRKRNKLW